MLLLGQEIVYGERAGMDVAKNKMCMCIKLMHHSFVFVAFTSHMVSNSEMHFGVLSLERS